MRDDLRVPKKAVRVEVLLTGQAPRRLELFVPEEHALGAVLEGEGAFLPAHDPEVGGWLVLHRARIVWVRLPADEVELFDHRHDVRIELVAGAAVDGSLLYQAAPERARVVDHLNEPSRFLEVWQEEGRMLVQKRFIVTLRER